MLRSYISLIEQDVDRLRARTSWIGQFWNDRVSAHVEQTHIAACISECNRFYTEAYTEANLVMEREQLLQRLADKY